MDIFIIMTQIPNCKRGGNMSIPACCKFALYRPSRSGNRQADHSLPPRFPLFVLCCRFCRRTAAKRSRSTLRCKVLRDLDHVRLIPTLSKEFIRRCFWCFSASFMAKIPPHFTHISIQTGFVYLLCTSKSLVFLLSLFADTPKTAQHYCPYYSTSRCFRQILFSMQEVSYVRVST